MHYRPLGTLGVEVSEISLGCNRLGEGTATTDHWVGLVRRARELGVTLFDTAANYRGSEEILQQALGSDDQAIIATKISGDGSAESPADHFAMEHVLRGAEAALTRLGRSRIDILQLHSPNPQQLRQSDWPLAFERLQQAGKLRWRGMAIENAEAGRWLIENKLIDVLQVTYNIIQSKWAPELFPLAQQHGIALMVRMPLCRGVLTGKFAHGVIPGARATLNRDALPGQIDKAASLQPLAQDYPGGLHHLAMHYALTPPAVSCLIPGARTIEQLEQNVAASNGFGLDAPMLTRLEAITESWHR